jgi:hypothetical protein
MGYLDFALLYLGAGVICAIAVFRRQRGGRRMLSAALAVPLWPLWAPIALTARPGSAPRASTPAARRIATALREGVEAASSSPLERLLSPESAARILADVERTEARRSEIEALLARSGFDVAEAKNRLAELEQKGAPARALATARLHLENVERLQGLHDRDRRALDELADLVEAMRTQLVLARYAGSSADGVGSIVGEVWSRVEGLGEVIDLEPSYAPSGGASSTSA